MASSLHVITDSAALFTESALARSPHLTIVPFRVEINGKRYAEGTEIDTDAYWHYVRDNWPPPTLHAPSVQDYQAALEKLRHRPVTVLVLPSSNHLSASFANAKQACQTMMGSMQLRLFDTHNFAIGLGLMIEHVLRASQRGEHPDNVLRSLHGMINRIYTLFYLDTMRPLEALGQVTRTQSVLGDMLEIQPLLTLEDGRILPIEKVYNRAAAFEKIAEFTAEFLEIANLVILYGNPEQGDDLRALRDRLALDLPGRHVPAFTYGPSLASLLGTRAIGITVHEIDSDNED